MIVRRSDRTGAVVPTAAARAQPSGAAPGREALRVPDPPSAVAVAATRAVNDELPNVGDAEQRLVDVLNTATFRRLTTLTFGSRARSTMLSAPAAVGLSAPLLYGATDPQLDRVARELTLQDLPRSQMLAAIESIVNGAQVKTALWGRPDFVFDKDFETRAAERLGTEVVTATADTVKHRIDGWSFGATHGRVIDLVDERVFDKEEVVVTSAVALDPLLSTAFDPKETIAEYTFIRADGETVAVRMMTGVASCLFGADADYRAVKLKLENDLSLIIIVPAEEVPLESVVARIASPGGWRIFHDGLTPAVGTVYIPKMRLEGRGDAGELLGDAARGPYEAVGSRPVRLNMARAVATLRLDEFGVAVGGGGAAGSAGKRAALLGYWSPERARAAQLGAVPELVEANRPFIYLLRNERNGLLVGAGVYEGPPEKPES